MALPSKIFPGKTFNRWTAVHFVSKQADGGNQRWLFKCICGNERVRIVGSVVHGTSKSCGCLRTEMMTTVTVKAGDSFGRLSAVRSAKNKNGYWLFKCTCGNDHVAKLYEVRAGEIKSCGCLRNETRTLPVKLGDAFGNLTAVRFIDEEASWIFKCVCGNECSPTVNKVRAGKIKSCGCHPSSPNASSRFVTEYQARRIKVRSGKRSRVSMMFSTLKLSAQKRGIDFAILKSDIESLVEKQGWICARTGIALNLVLGEGQKPFGPTIDRIDSERGYEPGNIQLVSFMYNTAKNKFSDDDVLAFAYALIAQQTLENRKAA